MTFGIIAVSLIFMLNGMAVQWQLKLKLARYSKVPVGSGLGGAEITKKLLDDNGIYDIQLIPADAHLSGNYKPANKTVHLTAEVYLGRNVAAAAVAAHEGGPVVQPATAHSMLMLPSRIVPAVHISTNLSHLIIIIGFGLMGFGSGNPNVLLIGIILFSVITLFSLITLPVEFDASASALKWVESLKMTSTRRNIIQPQIY